MPMHGDFRSFETALQDAIKRKKTGADRKTARALWLLHMDLWI